MNQYENTFSSANRLINLVNDFKYSLRNEYDRDVVMLDLKRVCDAASQLMHQYVKEANK